MNSEVLKAAAMYFLTSAMTAVATRYHLTGDQTAAITADVVALGSGVVGVALHWIAFKTVPPGAGK